MDVFAIYRQRLTRIVGWDDAQISDITYFTDFSSMDHKHVMVRFVYIKNISVISVENALCLKMLRLITTSA